MLGGGGLVLITGLHDGVYKSDKSDNEGNTSEHPVNFVPWGVARKQDKGPVNVVDDGIRSCRMSEGL